MFLLNDGTILLNEVAPRPHNTGHYTYEACECDQFENHLRAVLGLPLGGTALRVGASDLTLVPPAVAATVAATAATAAAAAAV
eukprot:18318-Heterococcus_DN1.PRE.4